jgi:hypothetical protein
VSSSVDKGDRSFPLIALVEQHESHVLIFPMLKRHCNQPRRMILGNISLHMTALDFSDGVSGKDR